MKQNIHDSVRFSRRVIWLTGVSGAGKTTLGRALHAELLSRGPAAFLDGDEVRAFFEGDLGYTRAERIANVKRIAFAAKLLADHGVTVVVANIAPYLEVRDFIRRKLGAAYVQVFVRAGPEVVRRRDVQGHYQRLARGELADFVGADDVYEEPRRPDVLVDTEQCTVAEGVTQVLAFLAQESP